MNERSPQLATRCLIDVGRSAIWRLGDSYSGKHFTDAYTWPRYGGSCANNHSGSRVSLKSSTNKVSGIY